MNDFEKQLYAAFARYDQKQAAAKRAAKTGKQKTKSTKRRLK